MLGSAIAAWVHYVSLFGTVGMLFAEFFLYRQDMPAKEARRMAILDGLYGAGALAIVASGFARALWFEKGWHFYEANWIFWTKVGVYTLWAIASLPPTFHYLQLRRTAKEGGVRIPLNQFRKIRACLVMQICLIPLPPLLAALMARGYGFTSP